MPHHMLQASIDRAVSAAGNIDWSISIRDAAGDELANHNADRTMEIASVGKLLLLIETARQCVEGSLAGERILSRDQTLRVADSGIWQHFRIDQLPIHDLCVLVASVSDNWATNVLLNHVGLQRINELCTSLGLVNTALLDYVREPRGSLDPVTFATGSASELSRLMSQMSKKELISQAVSEQVNGWLATGVDLSMVASALGLDPLSHATSGRNFFVRNKTGSDPGVRADVGALGRDSFQLSYAVIANWDSSDLLTSDAALAGMRAIGEILRETIDSNPN